MFVDMSKTQTLLLVVVVVVVVADEDTFVIDTGLYFLDTVSGGIVNNTGLPNA